MCSLPLHLQTKFSPGKPFSHIWPPSVQVTPAAKEPITDYGIEEASQSDRSDEEQLDLDDNSSEKFDLEGGDSFANTLQRNSSNSSKPRDYPPSVSQTAQPSSARILEVPNSSARSWRTDFKHRQQANAASMTELRTLVNPLLQSPAAGVLPLSNGMRPVSLGPLGLTSSLPPISAPFPASSSRYLPASADPSPLSSNGAPLPLRVPTLFMGPPPFLSGLQSHPSAFSTNVAAPTLLSSSFSPQTTRSSVQPEASAGSSPLPYASPSLLRPNSKGVRGQTKSHICHSSVDECSQYCLEGFKFCLWHILEDPAAPYKQCNFIETPTQDRCRFPVFQMANELRWVSIFLCPPFMPFVGFQSIQ